MLQFGAFWWIFGSVLPLKNFENYHFLYKNNTNLDKLWDNSRKENFENTLRLMSFGVYVEIILKKMVVLGVVQLHAYAWDMIAPPKKF